MVQFQNEIEIHASPEAVFDELSDQRHEMCWSPKLRSVELLSGEPVTVGSRLRARWAGTPGNTVVYTEHARPTRWAMRFTSWLMIAETAGDLSPTTTRLVSRFDARPHGWMRLVFPMFMQVMKRQERANMVNLKRVLEGSATR
jgi:hypothetical protein